MDSKRAERLCVKDRVGNPFSLLVHPFRFSPETEN